MKLGIILQSNNPEHAWNAFRLGITALKAGNQAEVFLMSEGSRLAPRKVSYTHLIAYALVQGAKSHPVMTHAFAELDGARDERGPVGGQAALAVQARVDRQVHEGLVLRACRTSRGGERLELLHRGDPEVDPEAHGGVPVLVGAQLPGEERRVVADARPATN
jgi:hypothetical protein